MNADTTQPIRSPAREVVAPPQLRPARFEDYEQIYALTSSYFRENQPREDWLGLWLNNPLWSRLGGHWPIGWVLEGNGGRIVGTFSNVPSLYRFRGSELLCANGRSWVVEPDYRGFALFLVNEHFGQPDVDLFMNTTVQKLAEPAIRSFSERAPRGEWDTASYFVTDHRAFAERALEKLRLPRFSVATLPLGAALWLKDALFSPRLASSTAGIEVACADRFDTRFDSFWEELVRLYPNRLLAVRDRQALAWHYARPIRRGRLWIFTASRGGLLRGYCVVKRQDLGESMRRLRLIDFQSLEPDTDLLPALLGPALMRAKQEGFAILEHLGANLPDLRAFDRSAPYRRKLESFEFYYQAADPDLQHDLRDPAVWAPSAYDGDASLE